MLSEAFSSVLRADRGGFNAQFAVARQQHPSLDGDAFGHFLGMCADPLIRAVASVHPECVTEVARAAYEIGLELVGLRFAGSDLQREVIAQGWQRVLPAAAPAIALAPRRVLTSFSNALHQLSATPGARPRQWIDRMETLAAQAATPEVLLKLGQIAAWRAGLAHYREGALAVADTLPETLALAAILPEGEEGGLFSGEPRWATIRRRLESNPWFVPGESFKRMKVALHAGSFRGFGGLFSEPPRIAGAGNAPGDFLVRSGNGCWLLTADAFGATFHRAPVEEFERACRREQGPRTSPGVRLKENTLEWNGDRLEVPVRGAITSMAINATTVAITSAL
ncbi:MAG: hypothetical protein V4710_23520, partial [Verrucomicrobiota bacterium]